MLLTLSIQRLKQGKIMQVNAISFPFYELYIRKRERGSFSIAKRKSFKSKEIAISQLVKLSIQETCSIFESRNPIKRRPRAIYLC